MGKSLLEAMSNVFGRVKRSELRRYAEAEGQSAFLDNVRCPCLMGTGRFAGEFVERVTKNRITTMQFKLAVLKDMVVQEEVEVGIHETIYPLQVPTEQLAMTRQFRIGRSSNSDIVIPDFSISGSHANIRYEKRVYHLEDLLSTNGSSVNGRPVWGKGVELRDGDRIKLGRFQFLLLWPESLYRTLILSQEPQAERAVAVPLEELTDALGRFDFIRLKQYCRKYSKENFKNLVGYPVLVGASLFPGTSWKGDEAVDTFRPFSSDDLGGKGRSLAGSMFPLAKNPASNTGEDQFIIGRAGIADLRMNDLTISKQHARIEVKEGRLFLSDTGSSNGTTVNAVKLHPFMPKEIRVDDRIGFGKNYFVLLSPERLYTNMQESQK
ncbi:MAG: FHA domain-containing protein [Magnetococcus sp. YQC-3]